MLATGVAARVSRPKSRRGMTDHTREFWREAHKLEPTDSSVRFYAVARRFCDPEACRYGIGVMHFDDTRGIRVMASGDVHTVVILLRADHGVDRRQHSEESF